MVGCSECECLCYTCTSAIAAVAATKRIYCYKNNLGKFCQVCLMSVFQFKPLLLLHPPVPAATPTDVIAREVVGTAILVCWQQSSDVGTAGVTRYRIYVDPADISQPIDTPDSETFFNVTGLLPITEYTFRVQAITEYQGIIVMSSVSDPGFGNTTTSG